MAKKSNSWFWWLTLVVGLLYLLGAWVPTAFSWWTGNFPAWAVFFFLAGLWGVLK